MTTFSTTIHAPAATAPNKTGLVAHCSVCGTQWQVQSEAKTDAKSCDFCNAASGAITIINEDASNPETNIVGL